MRTETEREEEHAETRGRSESVATRICLVNRQIKCYFSQPEPGKKEDGRVYMVKAKKKKKKKKRIFWVAQRTSWTV